MTYHQLIEQLRAKLALIVHFSHHSNMREGGVFPQDLLDAIANSNVWPLSCCLVWPTHTMNLPGSVGVILRPRSIESIVAVSSTDAGSLTWQDNTEGSLGFPLTLDTFNSSFEVAPDDYNEWRVRDSEAIGIYFENQPYAKKRRHLVSGGLNLDEVISAEPITINEILSTFPDYPILTRQAGRLIAANIPGTFVYP